MAKKSKCLWTVVKPHRVTDLSKLVNLCRVKTFSIILTPNMASSSSANHDAVAKMQIETPLHEDNNSGGEK